MKVLLINSPAKEHPIVRDMAGGFGFDGGEGAIVLPPLDLAYMAATLLNKGKEVKIIDSDVENYSKEDVYRFTKEYKPDTIIATASLPSIYKDCSFLRDMRQYTSAKIMVKTNIAYPSILKEMLQRSLADLCIFGECDINIDKIIIGEDKRGTAYLKEADLRVEESSIITNLDELPFPARNLLPNEEYRYILLGDRVTAMQTSRGCPFPCSYYCPYPLVQGKKWRARSPGHVVCEIEDIVKNYNIQKILFRDATFTHDKERTGKICDLIVEKKIKISWWCETRVDRLNLELMQKMRQAGCLGMNIGVETGDPQVLQTQAKIGMTLEKLKTIRRAAQELGLQLHFLLMIGLPKETKGSLYKTYRLICDLKPKSLGVCIITPYPGTPLYAEAKEKGWIETEDWTRFGGHLPVMHTEFLSPSDLLKAQGLIYRGFHLSTLNSWTSRLKLKTLNLYFKQWSKLKVKSDG